MQVIAIKSGEDGGKSLGGLGSPLCKGDCLLDSEQSEGVNCAKRGKRSETGSSNGSKGKLGNCLSCLLPEMDLRQLS